MKKPSKISAGLALAFATVLVAGCGGSGDDGVQPPPPAPVPMPPPTPVAMNPTVGLVTQLVGQGGSDTAEPVVLSDVAFPTNDTAEPDAV